MPVAYVSQSVNGYTLADIGEENPEDYYDQLVLVIKGNGCELDAPCWRIWSHELDKAVSFVDLLRERNEVKRADYIVRRTHNPRH